MIRKILFFLMAAILAWDYVTAATGESALERAYAAVLSGEMRAHAHALYHEAEPLLHDRARL